MSSLVACGSSTNSTPQSPVFTSTPVTAASQDMSYSYQLAATDPSGGAVTFSLVTEPAGATLSGNTINWTPTAQQSRVSNGFTAKATTSSGGSATQSWTVTPTGTVTVNWVDTDWTPAGPVQVPAPGNLVPSALVPQPDGSLELLSGTLVSPGVYTIAPVPGGFYWLIQGAPPDIAPPPTGFWTNSSTFDLGRDTVGAPTGLLGSTEQITFDFNLSGLDASMTPGVVGFITDNPPAPPIYLTPQAGATTLSASEVVSSRIDWTTVNTAFLVQYEPISLGSVNKLVLGPELTFSNLALTNGTTNPINGALAASPQASLDLSIPGSQWATLFQNVAPGMATPMNSWLSIAPEPYVIGVNAKPELFEPSVGSNLYLVQPDPANGIPFPINSCPSTPFFLPVAVEPPILTDQNFGTLQYGDPFPANWTRELAFCQSVTVPFEVGSQSFPIALNYGMAVDPSNPAMAPLAGPVVNPMIDGSNLFTTTSGNNTAATLSWTASPGTSPYGYTVYVFQVIPMQNGFGLMVLGNYSTAQTSMTLPPLTAGNTYLFVIITEVDGIANMQTSPYRSQLPTGFATVMSAQVAISAGASGPQLRGDPKELKRFLHPEGKRYRAVASHE
ncbi:MAG: fibronectin type III domain-containing protein [Terriglobales bacterium]